MGCISGGIDPKGGRPGVRHVLPERAALQRGTWILFFPAVALFSAILVLLYRRRNVATANSGAVSDSPESVSVGR
jgi:hypothetical protein